MNFQISYEALKQILITAKSRFKLAISCFVITSFFYGFQTHSFPKEGRAGVICASLLMLLMLVFRGFEAEKKKKFEHLRLPVFVAVVMTLFGWLAGSTSFQEAANLLGGVAVVFLLLTALAFALIEYIFFDFNEVFEAVRKSGVSEDELQNTLGLLYLVVWAFSIGGTFLIINFIDV